MPTPNPSTPARGSHAARVSELEAEVRQLRKKVGDLARSLAESEENRRLLRETLDATLHQIELQAIAIDGLRLELESAHTKVAALVARESALHPASSRVPTPMSPPRALDVRKLTLVDLLPLAKGAGERLKAMRQEGREVDVELRVLRQAIQFMKDGMFWEAQVVLHGLRVALEAQHAPTVFVEEEASPPAPLRPAARSVKTARIPPTPPKSTVKDKRGRSRP